MKRRVHVTVRGKVQGVWFRQSSKDVALSLGLCGWVRNLHDGSVEGEFEGDPDAVQSMLNWLKRGPPLARVDELSVGDQPPKCETSFEILSAP